MCRRGIHDSFHASLLRIHKPNDDRLFPGRLDAQIVDSDEHVEEWAADKVIAHRGAKDNAMFEVLWKAGDKTWMDLAQVRELKLLDAYLEVLGVDSVADLSDGTGNPTNDDPQIYLGNLQIEDSQNYKVHEIPSVSSFPLSTHLVPILSARCTMPEPPSKGHPGFRIRDERCVYLFRDRSITFLIHPLQLDLYVCFHIAVLYRKEHQHTYPIGYNEFATKFNAHPHYLGKFCSFDTDVNEWNRLEPLHGRNCSVFPVPTEFLDMSFVDPRHTQLVQLNFLTENGDVGYYESLACSPRRRCS